MDFDKLTSLVVLGASGFVGRHLLQSNLPMPIKAVARRTPPNVGSQPKTTWYAADLLDSKSLDSVISPGDVLINLAYMSSNVADENMRLIDNVVASCIRNKSKRLVHCSTSIVVGAVKSSRIVETTPCVPVTSYEQTKWAIEQRTLNALSGGVDVGILRPTAVLGTGGQNLIKLARSLQSGEKIMNYFTACLFGRRPMHLVSVRDVTAALIHLATLPVTMNGAVYIISADEDPGNNFQSVEANLLSSLGLHPRKVPLLPVPSQLLALLLKLRRRSDADPNRFYDSQRIRATGFKPTDSVAIAVRDFGANLRAQQTRLDS